MIIYRQNNRGAFAGNNTFLWMLQPFLHPIISVTSESVLPTGLIAAPRLARQTPLPKILSTPRTTVKLPAPPILTSPRHLARNQTRLRTRSRLFGPVGPQRYYTDARGQYRIFNTAEYQFFRQVNATFHDDLNGPAPDTYLDANNAAINYGSDVTMQIGWSAAGGKRRALLKFDLSVLPPGSTVTRARLLLDTTVAAASTAIAAKLRRITQAWVESTATWDDYDTALAWAAPGGDFTSENEVDWKLPTWAGDFEISGLQVLAQDAIDNRSGLLHLILMRQTESGTDSDITVRSGEHGSAVVKKPRLLIEVTLPAEADTPFGSNATLPHEPADEHIDGAWYFGMQWFDGALPSGLMPLGVAADRFARIDVAGGAAVAQPPQRPQDVVLVQSGGGVVQIVSRYWQSDANRATEWAVTYTTDGADPGEPPNQAPTATVAMTPGRVAVLVYDLPAQADGTTIKVRLQTRRQSSSVWYYSEGSAVLTATADAAGGSAPPGGSGFAAP